MNKLRPPEPLNTLASVDPRLPHWAKGLWLLKQGATNTTNVTLTPKEAEGLLWGIASLRKSFRPSGPDLTALGLDTPAGTLATATDEVGDDHDVASGD